MTESIKSEKVKIEYKIR